MSKLVQRIVALVVMLAVVMSATAYGASTFVVDYQELKSDAPVVMTVNGEEIHADEYASYMMSQIINYQQMYAMSGLSEKNMASTFGDAAKESAKQQVALIHIVKQKMDELGLSLSYSQIRTLLRQTSRMRSSSAARTLICSVWLRSALTWTTTITTSMSAHAHRC